MFLKPPQRGRSAHIRRPFHRKSTSQFTSDLHSRQQARSRTRSHPPHALTQRHQVQSQLRKPLVLISIAKMFVSYFFRIGQPKRAVKIFQWITRPDFPGGVADDSEFYAVLVDGFCKNGMILDSLRVLRVMASENLVMGSEVRMWVYRGLLREARVKEALELNAALDCGTLRSDGGTLGLKDVVDLLDRMIANWVD
ncbi:hypothetical protein DH2020_013513 [Rehmannia glutinosa]|uniref:Pentatricopeptide repeat-containing protein n=1 Tax=Rehmannia glutinosa TaxID=99300 RepID=A0ABR0X5U5_REHGL